MEDAETVPAEDKVIEPQETVMDQETSAPEEIPEAQEEAEQAPVDKTVPLSAMQKERKKRQEAELKNQWYEEQLNKKPAPEPVEDDSRFESVSREDLSKAQHEIIRAVDEKNWIKNNADKVDRINDELVDFLKQRPHLRSAIADAPNRYEEAWTLMTALNPKSAPAPKSTHKGAAQKNAPQSIARVPKSSAMSDAVDVMGMNDSEFLAWRNSKRRAGR